MKIYTLEAKQVLPITKTECWSFFSNPKNLQKITPPDMDFEIISDLKEKMYSGQIIVYRIKLLFGIKVSWVTEITQVVNEKFFIDEQRFGPYKFWHHQHEFSETENGMEIHDLVHYAIPAGLLGRIVHSLFIRARLKGIFQYREDYLKSNFIKEQ